MAEESPLVKLRSSNRYPWKASELQRPSRWTTVLFPPVAWKIEVAPPTRNEWVPTLALGYPSSSPASPR